MLPLQSLSMAGTWFSHINTIGTLAKAYASSRLSTNDIFGLVPVIAQAGATESSDSTEDSLVWRGLGVCGDEGAILLSSSASVNRVMPARCHRRLKHNGQEYYGFTMSDLQQERASREPRVSRAGHPAHGSDGLMLPLSYLQLADMSSLSRYLDNVDWEKLAIKGLKFGVPLMCPATIPYIAGASMVENGYDIYQNGVTLNNAFGLAASGLIVFGPDGKTLLSAAGFDDVGIRADSFAALYQSVNYGGATPAGSAFAWAQSCGMTSCLG